MAKKKGSKKKGKKKDKKSAKKKDKKKKRKSKADEPTDEIPTTEIPLPEEEKGSGGGGLIIIPIISILLLVWIVLLRLDIFPQFYFESSDQVPFAIAAVLQILFIVLLALAYNARTQRVVDEEEKIIKDLKKTYSDQEEEVGVDHEGKEVDGGELLEVEPDYIEVELVEEEEEEEVAPQPVKKDWGIIEYPPQITGGVYSDTLVPVGGGTILKLRTIVARACLICDKQVDCWPIARRYISKDDFKFNAECKGGLRRLGVEEL